MKCARSQGKPGFTLIELLVVVAIIAVLLSILLPSLVGAREQAKQVFCKANLKSQGEAAAFYRDDHKGFGVCGITDIQRIEYTIYSYSILPYLGDFDGPKVGLWRSALPVGNYDWELPRQLLRARPLQCPCDPVLRTNKGFPRTLSYVSNAMPRLYPAESIAADAAGGGPPGDRWTGFPASGAMYRGIYRMDDFSGSYDSSRTTFVTEAHASLDSAMHEPPRNRDFRFFHFYFTSHLPFGLHPRIASDLRHPGGLSVLFFDGHSETMKHSKFDAGYGRSLGLRLRYVASVPQGYE
ncbi:MAG: prepilin-type N-terminal cleavage/methylation domain-containing protein [Phycisphaerales bacterium]|nr:prepilin-type N-terminal cleavage/methylation domain-containing protein [Phycisphaerales bacterium]